MEKHTVDDAEEKNEINKKEKIFLIHVYFNQEFWLYVEINGSAILEDLDYFLRKIWVECCDHRSKFTINGGAYYSHVEAMGKAIHRILPVTRSFDYIYDFGTPTELKGNVITSRFGILKNGIRLIAQNNLPDNILCTLCQKTSHVICRDCFETYCQTCKQNHTSCDREYCMLPVVNSPRMGL